MGTYKPISSYPTRTTSTAPTTSGGSTGSYTAPTTVITGASVSEQVAISSEAIFTDGLLAFPFYSLTNASGQMLRPGAAAALSIPVPFRGSIVGLSFVASTACSGTYTVHVNTVAQTPKIVVSAGTAATATFPESDFTFAEGSVLDVRATGVATSAVVEIIMYLAQIQSTIL